MARPRTTTDSDLLQAARQCFIEHGPGVATSLIARRAGVSQGTLFHRFGNKRALMIKALRPLPDAVLLERLAAGPDHRPLRDQLVEIGTAVGSFCARANPAIATLRAAGVTRGEVFADRSESPLGMTRDALATWLRAAGDQGRTTDLAPEIVADVLIRALHVRPFDAEQGFSFDRIEAVVGTLWRGLRPLGGE